VSFESFSITEAFFDQRSFSEVGSVGGLRALCGLKGFFLKPLIGGKK